jgi:predicted NUDIX family NTP pyrophosphohydrolase
MFRRRKDQLQVFLVHPGGPYWKNKDAGAWSIPKGEHGEKEDPLDAAKREFEDGVAPEVRPPAGIFGGRPRGLVFIGRCPKANP